MKWQMKGKQQQQQSRISFFVEVFLLFKVFINVTIMKTQGVIQIF